MTVPYVFKNATGTIPLSQLDDNFTAVVDKATLAGTSGATLIGITPAGTISATTVAGALNELDTEKATTASVALKANISSLAAPTGAATVGFTPSGTMVATNVQTAITELSTSFVPTSASAVGFTPSGTITSTNVQDAIVEINTDLAASTGASAVGFAPIGTIAATTVQAAIAEINTDLALSTGAALVGFAPIGTIAATTVQAAIAEINTDLALSTGAALVGFAPIGTIAATTVQTAIAEINTDLAFSTGSTLVGNIQPGTGAVARTVNAKLREMVSVKDFGAVGNGVTDDTAAIQAAITATSAGIILIPEGTYKVSSTISWTKNNIYVEGEGQGATYILFTNATADVFRIGDGTANPGDTGISNLSITSSVVKTNGAAVKVQNGHNVRLSYIRLVENMFYGFYFEAGAEQFLYYLSDFEINSGTIGISIGLTGSMWVQDLWIERGVVASTNIGIDIVNASGLFISNIDVIAATDIGIRVRPQAGKAARGLAFNNVLADTCVNYGWAINPAGTGYVCQFSAVNCWGATSSATAGAGFATLATGGGTIIGVLLTAFRAINNKGYGIVIGSGSKIQLVNCQSTANSQSGSGVYHGLGVANNISNWTVVGGLFGASDSIATLQGYGIFIGTGNTNYSIVGANLNGNVTGPILDASNTGILLANQGYINAKAGLATITGGTASVAVTHGLSYTPTVQDVLLTPLVNLGAWGVNSFWVSAATSTTFTISVNANATVDIYFSWRVSRPGI